MGGAAVAAGAEVGAAAEVAAGAAAGAAVGAGAQDASNKVAANAMQKSVLLYISLLLIRLLCYRGHPCPPYTPVSITTTAPVAARSNQPARPGIARRAHHP